MDAKFGASFSLKYSEEMGIDPKDCFRAALTELKIKRLRLMSYWDIHEPTQGKYDFTALDWQFALAKKHGAVISLAVGLRQPRWPESHWPTWVKELSITEWQLALQDFIGVVVNRYKDHPSLGSWQLENEALLKTFGQNGNFDRNRLKAEYLQIKKLDSKHPVIMSVSDSWGMPFFGPKPDIYAFSIYRYFYDRGQYRHSNRSALIYRLRAASIRLIKRRDVFIHELQVEPWGPNATINMTISEQQKSMNLEKVKEAITYVYKTTLLPADLWGLEWWYWLKITKNRPEIWEYMRSVFISEKHM